VSIVSAVATAGFALAFLLGSGSRAGAWTIHIRYDKSREIDVPLKVGT
jgi:hypothetical protein